MLMMLADLDEQGMLQDGTLVFNLEPKPAPRPDLQAGTITHFTRRYICGMQGCSGIKIDGPRVFKECVLSQ